MGGEIINKQIENLLILILISLEWLFSSRDNIKTVMRRNTKGDQVFLGH